MPLAEVGVFAGFNATDLKAIEPYLNRATYPAAAVIFRESEVGNEVLIITKGIASAYLQIPNTNIRLATFAPGTIFGELAILDEGVRSATVVADDGACMPRVDYIKLRRALRQITEHCHPAAGGDRP